MVMPVKQLEMMQHIGRLYRTWASSFEADVGISGVRWRILLALHNGLISQKNLIKKLQIDAATLTRHVKAMEKDSLLTRAVDENDNRVINVEITEAGLVLLHQTRVKRDAFLQKMMCDVSDEEIDVLLATLDKIQARLCNVQSSLEK